MGYRMRAVERRTAAERTFLALLIGFGGQIAGRLLDLQWHLTHEGFEDAGQQLQAHWLIWLTTVFVTWVAVVGIRTARDVMERRGYFIVVTANLAYGAVAIIHFFQHLDHVEVDWAHVLLAVFSVAAAAGVIWVIVVRRLSQHGRAET